jgi:hypothetical protein
VPGEQRQQTAGNRQSSSHLSNVQDVAARDCLDWRGSQPARRLPSRVAVHC